MRSVFKRTISILFLALLSIACGGGGGGGGTDTTSNTNDNSGLLKKGTDTAVRIIHGNVQASPIALKVGEQTIQRSRFAEEKFYRAVSQGPVELRIEQFNGNALTSIPVELQSKTEYTLLVGIGRSGQPSFNLITDVTQVPAAGSNLVRIINSLSGAGEIVAEIGGVSLGTVSVGGASDFVNVPSGEASLLVRTRGGATLAQQQIGLDDQGETTLLISGDSSIGYVVVRAFKDLD